MYPFRDGDTFAMFSNIIDNVTNEINLLDNEYVLKASPTELEQGKDPIFGELEVFLNKRNHFV